MNKLSLSKKLSSTFIGIFLISCNTPQLTISSSRDLKKFMSIELQKSSKLDVEKIMGRPQQSKIIDGELYWLYFNDKTKSNNPKITIGFNKNVADFKNIKVGGEIDLQDLLKIFPQASFIKEPVKSPISHIVLFDYKLIDHRSGIEIYMEYKRQSKEEVRYVSLGTKDDSRALTNNRE